MGLSISPVRLFARELGKPGRPHGHARTLVPCPPWTGWQGGPLPHGADCEPEDPAESTLHEMGCRSRRPALEPRLSDAQTPSSQTWDGGWTSGRGLLNRKARHCCAQRCGRLPAVKCPPESSLPPCPPGNRTPLPAHRRSVLLSQAGTLALNASRKRRQEELRSRRPVCDTPHTPMRSSRGGASSHPPASAPSELWFSGLRKGPPTCFSEEV